MKDTESAFNWIIDLLEHRGITYRISGGLAARIYGSNRELADIDIEIEDEDIQKLVEDVRTFIIFGPAHYKDEDWDLELMTLKYRGQEIDLAGTQAKIFDKQTQSWSSCSSDLKDVEMKEVFGRTVPVESKESLIEYKTKIGRNVDIEDVRQLTSK